MARTLAPAVPQSPEVQWLHILVGPHQPRAGRPCPRGRPGRDLPKVSCGPAPGTARLTPAPSGTPRTHLAPQS